MVFARAHIWMLLGEVLVQELNDLYTSGCFLGNQNAKKTILIANCNSNSVITFYWGEPCPGRLAPAMQELPNGLDWGHAQLESLLSIVRGAVARGYFRMDPSVPLQIAPSIEAFRSLREHL